MVEIRLDAYLDRLKGEEGQQRQSERRQVPTYVELANESGISPVTLSRIANGHIKQMNLSVLASLITSLRQRGFDTEVSDLLVYQAQDMQHGAKDQPPAGEVMKPIRELIQLELKLQQPSIRKQAYELRAGSDLVGTLHWPSALRSLCIAETAEGSWTFDRKGFFNVRVTAREIGSEQDIFVYSPNWKGVGTMEHADGREFDLHHTNWWNYRFRVTQKQAQGEEIELLSVKINIRFLRGAADVVLQPQLAQMEDAGLLTMFSCYLTAMAVEDMTAMGAA